MEVVRVSAEDGAGLMAPLEAADNGADLRLACPAPPALASTPCMLGIDEAGRGPVLGPMSYAACWCPVEWGAALKETGAADSKALDEAAREKCFARVCAHPDKIAWAVHLIAPNTISRQMLRRSKVSLNELSHDAAIGLVQQALDDGADVQELYVDTVGPPEKYQEKLQRRFPNLKKVVVAKKADATFPVVGAASICAKVSRDRALSHWKFPEQVAIQGDAWGSGYPGDPATKRFLQDNLDSVFGFPQLVRFSWSTADKIIEEKCFASEWSDNEDEGAASQQSISSFFQGGKSAPKARHAFFSDRKLTPSTSLF